MLLSIIFLLHVVLANETSDPRQSSLLMPCSETSPERCPSDSDCDKLGPQCLICMCPADCLYGHKSEVTCNVHPDISCNGKRSFERNFDCRYCFQTDPSHHTCKDNFDCQSTGDPNKLHYRANCSVHDETLCLGRRQFMKQKKCNWTGGYKWSTALALSITLGGFGADRFYLGHWQEGIGKLFSFGGLGVWTLVDVVLIGIRYVGPADGSLYI